MDISLILTKNYPNSEWVLIGNKYSDLKWLSKDAKPTEKELLSQWDEVNKEYVVEQIREQRQAAYSYSADPLFFKYQAGEVSKDEWLEARALVVEQFPYPKS